MKELSIFQHPDFGTVRNVVIKGEPVVCRKGCLRYSRINEQPKSDGWT